MEMHQVRYFLAVCEHLSFTQAARRCHVTQPSLTAGACVLFYWNVAVARLYEFANAIAEAERADATEPGMVWARAEAIEAAIRLIAPMMPHLAETLNVARDPAAPFAPFVRNSGTHPILRQKRHLQRGRPPQLFGTSRNLVFLGDLCREG